MKTVYALRDPRDPHPARPAFIGASPDPGARLRADISLARDGEPGPKYQWIRSLLKNGIRPKFHPIEEVSVEKAPARVAFWKAVLGQTIPPPTRFTHQRSIKGTRDFRHPNPETAIHTSLRPLPKPSRRRDDPTTIRIKRQIRLYAPQPPPFTVRSEQTSKPNPQTLNDKHEN